MNNLEVENEVNKYEISLYDKQKNFIETDLGKTINAGLDIGIKALLPNLIENQVISIKNAIIEQGFKSGDRKSVV